MNPTYGIATHTTLIIHAERFDRTFATFSKEKSGLLTYFFIFVISALDTLSLLNVLICSRRKNEEANKPRGFR